MDYFINFIKIILCERVPIHLILPSFISTLFYRRNLLCLVINFFNTVLYKIDWERKIFSFVYPNTSNFPMWACLTLSSCKAIYTTCLECVKYFLSDFTFSKAFTFISLPSFLGTWYIHTHRETCVLSKRFEPKSFPLKFNPSTFEYNIHYVEVD